MDETTRELETFARRRVPSRPVASDFDPAVLPEPAKIAARLVWRRRVVNERASVELARRLRSLAARAGLDGAVDAALARLEDDEARHVALTTEMLEALGAPVPPVTESLRPRAGEAPAIALLRDVLTGLTVCESVSAARYAAVRRATDLRVPRAGVEHMLRDEVALARLGFTLLSPARGAARRATDAAEIDRIIGEELGATFRELDVVVGLDAERRGARPTPRPQPADNPGVVEPAIDAAAFYQAIESRIVPRLEAHGIAAREAWVDRWSEDPSGRG